MQIYMDFLADGEMDWKMYVNPNITIDGKGVTLNGEFHRFIDIVRISIDGKEKTFHEALVWSKKADVIPPEAKELMTLKNLSIPAMTFLVDSLAPSCILPLSKEIEQIPEMEMKKLARGMAVRIARQRREVNS